MKTITICDGFDSRAVYQLDGDTLTMTATGGCTDALAANGCEVSEGMDDAAIAAAVRDAWTGDGYDGDPDENGLVVHVTGTA